MNNNEVKECKHYCPNYYSDDIGYEEKDRINACGLTRTGYHEMSYKKCSDIPDCYFKRLLQLKAENEQLRGLLGKPYKRRLDLENKSLTQKLEKAREDFNNIMIVASDTNTYYIAQQALKELEK